MDYQITAADAVKNVLWRDESVVRLSGGFKLDKTNLKSDLTLLPKGALLYLNHSTRIAKLVKTAKVYEELAAAGTSLKVYKGDQFKAGEFIGYNGVSVEISAIDESNALYNVLTLASALDGAAAVPVNSICFEDGAAAASNAVPMELANALNYIDVKISSTNTPSVTGIIQAYEVKEANLPYPVHADHKVSLTSRFMFI